MSSEIGVYVFHNQETDQTYCGSTDNLIRREKEHRGFLTNGRHPNKRFQKAYNGNQNFDFISVPLQNREEAFDLEQAILNEHLGNPLFLNISRDARYCNTEMTDEIREKIRRAKLGKSVHTPESRAKIGAASKGNTHRLGKSLSDYQKQKLLEALTGRVVSEETREKIRQANLGKTHSQETIDKLRIIKTGTVMSEDAKRKMSEASLGKRKSPEHAANIRAALQTLATKVSLYGVVYDSMAQAANALGISAGTVHYRVNNDKHTECFYV